MTEKSIRRILSALGLIAVLVLFLWASNEDYKETVIHNMPNETYHAIHCKLGHGCTDKEIIKEYHPNKTYYDSLNQ